MQSQSLDRIGFGPVFHIADNPGRNDPGSGEINYANVYRAIQKSGYAGYVAMEYLPLGNQVESLTKALKDFHASETVRTATVRESYSVDST